jgi:hypothetical protein
MPCPGPVRTKLDEGEGTAGKLINDPSVYEAVQDVIIGVEESRLLRWLIRNRQKKGIETRYEEEGGPDPGSLKEESLDPDGDRELEDALRGQEPPAAPGEGGNDLGNEGRNRR